MATAEALKDLTEISTQIESAVMPVRLRLRNRRG